MIISNYSKVHKKKRFVLILYVLHLLDKLEKLFEYSVDQTARVPANWDWKCVEPQFTLSENEWQSKYFKKLTCTFLENPSFDLIQSDQVLLFLSSRYFWELFKYFKHSLTFRLLFSLARSQWLVTRQAHVTRIPGPFEITFSRRHEPRERRNEDGTSNIDSQCDVGTLLRHHCRIWRREAVWGQIACKLRANRVQLVGNPQLRIQVKRGFRVWFGECNPKQEHWRNTGSIAQIKCNCEDSTRENFSLSNKGIEFVFLFISTRDHTKQ